MSSKIQINLASEPFRRDRPMIVGSVAAGLVLICLLALQVSLIVMQRDEAAETRNAVQRLEEQLAAVSREENKLESVLRLPENAEVLERSIFLNALLKRKGISWTRMFSDLEKVVPHNVRLVAIRPQVTVDSQVVLDMVVGAQSSEPVLKMLMDLEASTLFGSTSLQNWVPPSQSDPLYKYRVSVSYAQKL